MNISEAIAHAIKKADRPTHGCMSSSQECKEEHMQLALWLAELKLFRYRNLIRCWQEGLFPPAADAFHQPTETYRKEHLQE